MNGIATITIADQPIGLKFGLPALRRVTEKMQQYDLVTNGRSNDLGLSHILYAGYMNNCIMRDVPVTLLFESFYEYVEVAEETEETKVELIAAIKAFEESKYVKKAMAANEKKKATLTTTEQSIGTKSNPSVTDVSVIPPQSIAV